MTIVTIAEVGLFVALPARAEKEIATAGTGNPTLTTGDAPDSICPYAWRLPGKGEQYDNLFQVYLNRFNHNSGIPTILSPLSFTFAGYLSYYYHGFANQNTGCLYWVSTLQNSNMAYYFDLTRSNLTYSSYGQGIGNTLRCLAR